MTKTEVLDSINRLLLTKWPDRTVYVDVCPVDFDRPSFWLAVQKHDMTDANRYLIKHDLQLKLTIYDQLDEHYEASWYRLSKETDEAAELLSQVLVVGKRHLKLGLKMLPRDPDPNQHLLDGQSARPGYRCICPCGGQLFAEGAGRHHTRGAKQWDFLNLLFP